MTRMTVKYLPAGGKMLMSERDLDYVIEHPRTSITKCIVALDHSKHMGEEKIAETLGCLGVVCAQCVFALHHIEQMTIKEVREMDIVEWDNGEVK